MTATENEIKKRHVPDEDRLRERLIDQIVVMTAVFTAITYLISIIRISNIGWSVRDLIFCTLIISAIGIALGRRRLSVRFKAVSISLLFLFAALTGCYNFGMLAGGVFYFVLVGVIIALFFSKRGVVVYGVLLTVFLCFVAYGFTSNILKIPSGASLLHANYSHWVVYILGFSLSFVIICVTILNYQIAIRKLIENVTCQRDKIEKNNQDLQQALSEIKTLKGILPLCSFCKKIRDDKGYWRAVDEYIYNHSEADISHSVCPECMKEHYPEEYEEIK